MFRVDLNETSASYCDGMNRRSFLQIGMAGMGAMSLPSILRAKEANGASSHDTSVILIWLDGGPSHLDTYDMKPSAPLECRGIWNPIPTNVPGIEITELFPLQAKCADKFSLIRSLHHDNGDHFTAAHYILTGRGGANGSDTAQRSPFIGSMAVSQTGARQAGMPPYVAVPFGMSVGLRPGYFGAGHVGIAHNPFETDGDPNAANFQVQNMALAPGLNLKRLESRAELSHRLDRLRRDVETKGTLEAMDRFDHQAFDLVTGAAARQAFSLESEDPRVRERYGRHTWGQSVLLARRLVEAGTTFVTVHFGGWDHHWDLQKGMENYLPKVDQCVSALIEDLVQRGLWEKTCVIVCGEFSRTPRMNDGGNGGAPMSMGTPGRDHWGNAMSCLIGGGGIQGGRIVGATNARGEAPSENPLHPSDLHHTLFHILGVDRNLSFLNHAGRPIPALEPGRVIQELL